MLLDRLKKEQRESVGKFFIAYIKQTRRQTMSLPTFVDNILKAYRQDRFGLPEMIE